MHIRQATPRDAAVLTACQVAMARETEGLDLATPTVRRGVEAVLADADKGVYYLAEEGCEAVGCLMITREWSDWRAGWVWWIQSVYVRPEVRRRGVFAALYAHVRRLVEAAPEVHGLRLYVDRRNLGACAVYESLGMDGDHYRLYEWIPTIPAGD